MKIKRLKIVNLRGFEQAELEFTPDMNLLVGVNGVGKTTVLDSIRICLSKILPDITASRSQKKSFGKEDIRIQSNFMTVNCTFELQDKEFTFFVHKNLESSIPRDSDNPREQVWETPDKEEYQPPLPKTFKELKKAPQQSLGLFFSTRRSLVSDAKSKAIGGQAGAFADALSNRELRLKEIADWMHVQEDIGNEHPQALKYLSAIKRSTEYFLPECKNLRAETSPKSRLIIEKEGTTLDIRQLSDGERGIFTLVLDLAKRLSQANPQLNDPVKDGSAIVLIDEIDLHLHPKWQRTVIEKLTKTFPNCQFIATTHSPQIISAVEPGQVMLLTNSGIIRPNQTRGIDSNWILSNLMETEERPIESLSAIKKVELLIRDGNFSDALEAMEEFHKQGLDLPYWSVLEARIARLEMLFE